VIDYDYIYQQNYNADLAYSGHLDRTRGCYMMNLSAYMQRLFNYAKSVRQQDGTWGVFVLDGSVAAFKPGTWNYSTESYFLVPCAASAKEGLFRYDRVIVQGRNLAENKVVQ
jgi:hypothetical protein